MILINDNWEQINDLQDVSRIIREYYNHELADKLDYLILLSEHSDEKYHELECELDYAYSENTSLENEIIDLENDIEELNKELEELREYKAMYEDLCK